VGIAAEEEVDVAEVARRVDNYLIRYIELG
jgi:hypothetical protein